MPKNWEIRKEEDDDVGRAAIAVCSLWAVGLGPYAGQSDHVGAAIRPHGRHSGLRQRSAPAKKVPTRAPMTGDLGRPEGPCHRAARRPCSSQRQCDWPTASEPCQTCLGPSPTTYSSAATARPTHQAARRPRSPQRLE
ncbi:hypothetical protein HPB50_014975 [Hyalomma asiaticum]|uniref:Uncharacterized protein n=1 Tax=Hyalomma asiaticum TaxID=266040 RepID=A0ACB7RK06_HYAAI|nr:hypothetical protein HPB50_014975 [Hyalomma asiaticum]